MLIAGVGELITGYINLDRWPMDAVAVAFVLSLMSLLARAGLRDSLRHFCVRASVVAASHQNAKTTRAESGNSITWRDLFT
jgi:hypothetical protein